ncbi:MAG: hypothetical protein A2Y10_17875 [Planctomycetes bacterium GWF2_41_51]|nr:MAG: hypothetical protein A2Y10_17875 [Planctomycetes bacterium GWF2_41_51]HBG25879.1 hypothetical protein [Phycisphaerales bacterium]
MKDKESKKAFENLPACVEEYIKLVIKKMRWQKKVREDVQAEFIAHFEDALHECKTNEEKEKAAKELIENFGDAELIAVLARRAKKRCRPLWQKLFIRAFQFVGIVIVLFIVYFIWFVSGKPTITTNYIEVANNLGRPTADESQNAAPLYELAAKTFDQQEYKCDSDYLSKSFYEVNQIDINHIKKWINQNDATLNLIAQGTEKPLCWQKIKTPDSNDNAMLSVILPHLSGYRRAAYGICWRAYLSAQDEQFQKALADTLTIYKFGQHQKGTRTLIENLVGISMQNKSTDTIRTILEKNDIPNEFLIPFKDKFTKIINAEDFSIVESFEFEKLFIYDEIQRSFVKSRFGIEHIYPKRLSVLMFGEGGNCNDNSRQPKKLDSLFRYVNLMFSFQNSQKTRKSVDEYFDFWKDITIATPHTFKACDLNSEAYKVIDKNILLRLLSPAMEKIISLSWRNRISSESTLTIVAVHVFKKQKGYLPESLQELITSGFLTSVPIDPFSDKPIVYKKRNNDNFALYSVGLDFDDDGGKMEISKDGKPDMWNTKDGDAVFWPVEVFRQELVPKNFSKS